MLRWLMDPFDSDVVQRALIAGVIVACLCAIVGTWVVLRGSAFLGDAMSHGVLPGVALASLIGGNIFLGAMAAALAMAYGVSAVSGASRLSADTSIGLLLVGMLAVGVIIVSHSQSYAVDLTGFLFGDVLAVRSGDIALLVLAFAVTVATAMIGRRAFVAVTFDPRKAATLGLRPTLAAAVLTVLIAVAIVASFRVVGTLLVFGLLIAPPAAAFIWADSIPRIMGAAAVIGAAAVALGLVVSWYAGTAGGATIAAVAVGIFFVSLAAAALRRHAAKAGALIAAALVAGCGAGGQPAATSTPPSDDHEAPPAGAQESAEPLTRLVVVDPVTGETSVLDVLDEVETPVGRFGAVEKLSGDGRFGYLHQADELTIVDAGSWTFDHGDHNHYYIGAPALVGSLQVAADSVAADQQVAAVRTGDGGLRLLDRNELGERRVGAASVGPVDRNDVAKVAPRREGLLVVTESGHLQTVDDDGATRSLPAQCPGATDPVVLSRSVFLGCADGALRVPVTGPEPTPTPIPFAADKPATTLGPLRHRARDDVLVTTVGDEVWVLDGGQRTWAKVPAPGVVAANTGDVGEVLTLTRDGVLHAVDISSGVQTGSVTLLPAGVPAGARLPVIEVDSERAYINNAAAGEIYEVDYGDQLRIARTFTTEVKPGLMVQAGR